MAAEKLHTQFSDDEGNIFYLENGTEDVMDSSGKPLSDGGDLSEASVQFTADSTRKLPQSGGRFKAFCGSVLKFLSDLQTVAFSGKYSDLSEKPSIPSGAAASQAVANNCTTTAAGSVLDARQGKVLMDKANQLSSDLGGLTFAQDAEGNWGYKPEGADTVIPFKSAVLSGANIYNQLWASGGNGSHLNATKYIFEDDYLSVFVVQSSSGIMGYGSEAGIAYRGEGAVTSLFSKRQSIGTDSSQSYYVIYIENPKAGDTLTFGQATGAQNRAVSIFAFV